MNMQEDFQAQVRAPMSDKDLAGMIMRYSASSQRLVKEFLTKISTPAQRDFTTATSYKYFNRAHGFIIERCRNFYNQPGTDTTPFVDHVSDKAGLFAMTYGYTNHFAEAFLMAGLPLNNDPNKKRENDTDTHEELQLTTEGINIFQSGIRRIMFQLGPRLAGKTVNLSLKNDLGGVKTLIDNRAFEGNPEIGIQGPARSFMTGTIYCVNGVISSREEPVNAFENHIYHRFSDYNRTIVRPMGILMGAKKRAEKNIAPEIPFQPEEPQI